jgi:hypothetical protein
MSSMRDDLNAALDGADDENFDETPQEVISDELESESSLDTESIDTPEESTLSLDDGAAPESADTPEAATPTDEAVAADTSAVSGDSLKAPVGWGPKEREDWSKIPRHLQDKVMGREKELNTMLQTTADARKTHEDFGQLANKYGAVLSGVMGNNPMETTANLFDTVANLRMGTPIQKAQIVADLISNFGVDINTLDSAIVGQAPPAEMQQNNQFEQQLNERMAPFEAMMGQQNAYQEQQAQQRQEQANTEVRDFGQTAEFLGDVRHDMADMIEMAAKRGQQMSVQQAYDKACAINPQISSVIQERQKHAQLTGSNNSMAAKRQAASSVNGTRGGTGGGGENMTMRDTLSASWDTQNSI